MAQVALQRVHVRTIWFKVFLYKPAEIVRQFAREAVARQACHGFIAHFDVHFLQLADEEHARHRVPLQRVLGGLLVAGPLAGAEEMIDPRLVIGRVKLLVGDRLAINRAMLARGLPARAGSAELYVRREERHERNDDNANDYEPKPILMTTYCTEHKLQ